MRNTIIEVANEIESMLSRGDVVESDNDFDEYVEGEDY